VSAPPYMKLYWGDYFHGAKSLKTAREHGAYLLLIGALWDAGGKLPDDDATLARHAFCTPQEWAALKPALMPFFRVVRGKLTQKRVTRELRAYAVTVSKRKLAGKIGGSASVGKDKGNGQANAKQMPPKPEPEPENSLEGINPSKSVRRADAKARLDGAFAQRSDPDPHEHLTAMERLAAFLARQDEEAIRASAEV
jgi:uncharacterized protein YdaU (DUF1376 family)